MADSETDINTSLYEDIIENLAGGLISVDLEMKVIVFNQQAERISETSRGSALSRPLKEVFIRDGWFVEAVNETIGKGRTFTDYKGMLHRRISPPLTVSITTTRVFDGEGAVRGASVFIKDLASGIRSLEAASLSGERLSQISTFAANLVHEIRNPLGGIRGAAQLLRKKTDEKKLGQFTDIIIRETDRLDALLKEMGDFTRPERLIKREINIHRVLDSVVLLMDQDKSALEIKREYDPSLPPVYGDEARLTQVFLNLIKNAGEASSEGGVVRVVTRMITGLHIAEAGAKGTKMAAIEVRDKGCGISHEDMEKIFTPFFTTKHRGSGLGMPISLKIVKEHGGLLNIDSTQAQGTTVSVYLPIAEKTASG
ncbi:MAG: nitrogen fixation sensor histidine kinase GnfL [Thermodesulfobacteriota bacterium]|nr:MAG: nitrogen fixation sensor histidine kinase GnfL [Thermodesulfobacteriota bacterium]